MATLKDVALRAGVNISTASRALNGSKNISKATTNLVQQAARELNYIPNANARILAGKRSNIVGIIVPEIHSDYFAKMINRLEARLQEKGYFLIIANTQYDVHKEARALENFINYNIDGIFLTCVVDMDAMSRYQHLLRENRIPLVALDTRQQGAECHQIMVDDASGLTEAVSHLVQRGHHKIGFLGDYILDLTRRTEMFQKALLHNGLDPDKNPIYSHPSARFEKAGYEDMKYFLSRSGSPRAYIAGYDDIAIGAMRAVWEAGLRIPEDISIIGNDNGRSTDYFYRKLTTLSPPVERMAEVGVDLMMNCISGGENDMVHHITLKPELIIRETT